MINFSCEFTTFCDTFPQEQYLAYPARLCSILPWMWMALMSRFVFFESIQLSRPLTFSIVFFLPINNILCFSWLSILEHLFFSYFTSCNNINTHHISICSDCLCFSNRFNFYYCHRFPMKHFLHLNKLWTICHFMSIQTINVACI